VTNDWQNAGVVILLIQGLRIVVLNISYDDVNELLVRMSFWNSSLTCYCVSGCLLGVSTNQMLTWFHWDLYGRAEGNTTSGAVAE